MEADAVSGEEVVRKVAWRLVPVLTVGYFLASLDRVNVGFAALQMNEDIGLTPEAFGFGAGLFFVAYCLFAVPGNLLMQRVGARLWLALVMAAWGVVSVGTAFARGPTSFAAIRILLGIAEAGYFPGVIYLFTLWFPRSYRSRMVAILMMALPVSSVLGSPLSAALLLTDGWLGLRGWHWLFIIEGLPAVLLGVACLLVLPRDLGTARFLTAPQKAWLAAALRDPAAVVAAASVPLWRVLIDPTVLLLTLVYIGGTAVTNALSLWQPQIIKGYHLTTFQVGLLNSLPFALASVAMYLWAARSDRTGERALHTALPLVVSGAALLCTTFVQGLVPMIAVLCVIVVFASMIKGPFWAMATEALPARISAPAIGQINALNNLGVFGATWVIGAIRGATGSFTYAMLPIAGLTFLACAIALWMGRRHRAQDLAEA